MRNRLAPRVERARVGRNGGTCDAARALMLTKKISALAAALFVIGACHQQTRTVGTSELYQQQARANVSQYQYPETRALVALVDDAANLVRSNGEAAFADFRVDGSRWRRGES